MYRTNIRKIIAWALLLLFSIFLLASCCTGDSEELGLNDPAVKANGNGESTSTEKTEDNPGTTDGRTFLEREKETDPIFAWEDPYADLSEDEIDRLQETMPQEEYQEYYRMRVYQIIAKTNYPIYYFYYSGRSEYKDGVVPGKPTGYDLGNAIASYAVPESFVLNMLADACVEMHLKEAFPVTIERKYQSEEERKKMEAMGEEPSYEVTHLIFTVDRCLWGDMRGDQKIYVVPRLVSNEFVDILMKPGRTFVSFLWRHDRTGERNGIVYPEYGLLVRGTFDYTDGQLTALSNLEDVSAYDGMSAEEMIGEGEVLAEKYRELLEYVRKM